MSTDVKPFATIHLPNGCRPSKACDPRGHRPLIEHARLARRGDDWWLTASDSFIAVALKVQAQGDVVEGWIPYKALRQLERGRPVEQLSPAAWRSRASGYIEVRYDLGNRMDHVVPLDFDKIGDGRLWETPSELTGEPLGIDPRLLRRLGRAMGIGRTYGLHLYPSGALKSISVECPLPGRRGLISPVRIGKGQ